MLTVPFIYKTDCKGKLQKVALTSIDLKQWAKFCCASIIHKKGKWGSLRDLLILEQGGQAFVFVFFIAALELFEKQGIIWHVPGLIPCARAQDGSGLALMNNRTDAPDTRRSCIQVTDLDFSCFPLSEHNSNMLDFFLYFCLLKK